MATKARQAVKALFPSKEETQWIHLQVQLAGQFVDVSPTGWEISTMEKQITERSNNKRYLNQLNEAFHIALIGISKEIFATLQYNKDNFILDSKSDFSQFKSEGVGLIKHFLAENPTIRFYLRVSNKNERPDSPTDIQSIFAKFNA